MFGLVVFGAMAVYLLISAGVVNWAIKHARQRGKSAKRWGWGAALVMYLIPFWDWIPTVAVHQYYCATEAGFWVYKTPEQWMKENPGVTLTLENEPSTNRQMDSTGLMETHRLDNRFDWVIKLHRQIPFLPFVRREESLIDRRNSDVLARYVDFSSGHRNPMVSSTSEIGDFKFWLSREMCGTGRARTDFVQQTNELYAFAKGAKK
jgi:hypothetical protein